MERRMPHQMRGTGRSNTITNGNQRQAATTAIGPMGRRKKKKKLDDHHDL
jgi:hypothetical protein